MGREQIFRKLRDLDVEHREDGDGGYALVDAISEWAETLDSTSRDELWDILLELISVQDPTLWGIALEMLVRGNPQKAASELGYLVKLNNRTTEWKDHVCLALLRLRHAPSGDICINHIREALGQKRRDALPLLAALSQIDSTSCIDLAADYFATALLSDELLTKHSGYIPAFIRNFLEVDPHLLRRLVQLTKERNSIAGKRLAKLIDEHLSRPSYAREIGDARVQQLKAEVKA
jgi:hypothetical protein